MLTGLQITEALKPIGCHICYSLIPHSVIESLQEQQSVMCCMYLMHNCVRNILMPTVKTYTVFYTALHMYLYPTFPFS